MIPNRNRLNQDWSNVTASEVIAKAEDLKGKVKDTLEAIKGKGTPAKDETPSPVTTPVKSETLILGMHPLTLGMAAGGLLLATIAAVIIYKQVKK